MSIFQDWNSGWKPFMWSVMQLVWFLRDPIMAGLLTAPGTQQQPLHCMYNLQYDHMMFTYLAPWIGARRVAICNKQI